METASTGGGASKEFYLKRNREMGLRLEGQERGPGRRAAGNVVGEGCVRVMLRDQGGGADWVRGTCPRSVLGN